MPHRALTSEEIGHLICPSHDWPREEVFGHVHKSFGRELTLGGEGDMSLDWLDTIQAKLNVYLEV